MKKQLAQVEAGFKEYQLALYLYGFGYFLEVLLQENFDSSYLSAISEKIDNKAFQYRELYTMVYSQIEECSKASLQSRFFSGLSVMNKTVGEVIAKTPVISKSQIDETLISTGEKLDTYEKRRVQTTMRQLVDRSSSCVRSFIDGIDAVNRLYNNQVTFIFNNECLYIRAD